jgi:hypothetical protein
MAWFDGGCVSPPPRLHWDPGKGCWRIEWPNQPDPNEQPNQPDIEQPNRPDLIFRLRPPAPSDERTAAMTPEINTRERIRQSRPWFATTGPPPKNERRRLRFHTETAPETNSLWQANLIPSAKNNPAEFFGTGSCALPDPFAELRLFRKIEALHRLGARVCYEFLAELAREWLLRDAIAQKVDRYVEALTPELLAITGGDQPLRAPLHEIQSLGES